MSSCCSLFPSTMAEDDDELLSNITSFANLEEMWDNSMYKGGSCPMMQLCELFYIATIKQMVRSLMGEDNLIRLIFHRSRCAIVTSLITMKSKKSPCCGWQALAVVFNRAPFCLFSVTENYFNSTVLNITKDCSTHYTKKKNGRDVPIPVL